MYIYFVTVILMTNSRTQIGMKIPIKNIEAIIFNWKRLKLMSQAIQSLHTQMQYTIQ